MNSISVKTILYTLLALIAFAGNSVLCRLALAEQQIDAASFTSIRLLSGMTVLLFIVWLKQTVHPKLRLSAHQSRKKTWFSAIALFIYAACFSYAYISLPTGAGALILFAAVQITMVSSTLLGGKKLKISEWAGLILAFTGLVYLLLPEFGHPSLYGFLMMLIAGMSWAIYTVLGKQSKAALRDTQRNFVYTLPFIILLSLFTYPSSVLSQQGILLAALSGAITSALGYTLWYLALRGLSATQASVLQLLVPIIAALGGLIFANELITWRLIIASLLVLGGILMVLFGQSLVKRPFK